MVLSGRWSLKIDSDCLADEQESYSSKSFVNCVKLNFDRTGSYEACVNIST